jgi:hypothetical protein
MVDLTRTDVKLLKRFMGEAGFARFSRRYPARNSSECEADPQNRTAFEKESRCHPKRSGSDEVAA